MTAFNNLLIPLPQALSLRHFAIKPSWSCEFAGEHAAARIVADIAERVSSGKVPLALQSAHSANSELAAYTNVKRGVRSLSRAEKDVLSKAKRK